MHAWSTLLAMRPWQVQREPPRENSGCAVRLRRALQSGGHALDAGRRMAGSAFWGLAGAGRSSLGYLGGMERGLLQLGRATLEEVAALEARRALGRHRAELHWRRP